MNDISANQTMGEISTPPTGWMTFLVALRRGSVGTAMKIQGALARSVFGYHVRMMRIIMTKLKMLMPGPAITFATAMAAGDATDRTRYGACDSNKSDDAVMVAARRVRESGAVGSRTCCRVNEHVRNEGCDNECAKPRAEEQAGVERTNADVCNTISLTQFSGRSRCCLRVV